VCWIRSRKIDFLLHIVFGHDPAGADPGVTAQLECLLDDVVVGKQETVGAIDAVCDVAQRIIGKLKDGAVTGGPPLVGVSVGNGAGGYRSRRDRPLWNHLRRVEDLDAAE
jgi:hypothetical protein